MWPHATNIPSWVLERFFSETGAGKHVPRCVMVDLEPTEACMCSVAFLLLNRALRTRNFSDSKLWMFGICNHAFILRIGF